MAIAGNVDRRRVPKPDKFGERRRELAGAALVTLSELGYARTSLREIAQKSEFTHAVLHYYFADKLDLIRCSIRHFKAKCVTRYDVVTSAARSREELVEGFLAKDGAKIANARKVVLPDGRKVFAGSTADGEPVK